jgi:hypothetical protein
MRLSRLLLLTAGLAAVGLYCAAGESADEPTPAGPADSALFLRVNERLRSGEGYYTAMGEELAAAGYFRGSVFNWRLPTLSLLQAAVPGPGWSAALLAALGVGTAGAWAFWYRRRGWGAASVAGALLLPMLPVWTNGATATNHDIWAGQLIAASLATRALGWRAVSLGLGAAALGLRELAVIYVLVMAALAAIEGARREAAVWLVGVAGFLALMGWHASQVSLQIGAGEPGPTWLALGGWCFVLLASRAYLPLFFSPTWINALFVAAALGGLVRLVGPVGRRVTATVVAYLGVFLFVGLPVNWYWGFLIAPLVPLGLVGWWWRAPDIEPTAA